MVLNLDAALIEKNSLRKVTVQQEVSLRDIIDIMKWKQTMDDFTYDCLQKKRIAQSAKKRVRPKKGCSLPSDNLTAAQRKNLNGDVISVNLNKPITYSHFKSLPSDMKTLYYNHLVEEFGATQTCIAKKFGIRNSVLYKYLKNNDVSVIKLDKGARLKKPYEWKLFCNGNYGKCESPATSSEDSIDILNGSKSKQFICNKLKKYHLEFTDVSQWHDILDMLASMPLHEGVTVVVTVYGGEKHV